MPTYLEAYRTKLGLKVQFETEATNVQKLTEETVQGHRFSFRDQRERLYLCKAINNDLLDHYQLKSLDGLLEADLRELRIVRTPSGKMALHVINDTYNYVPPEDEYDAVIRCLGFTYDDTMFAKSARPERGAGRKRKFPLINGDYESANVPGMYFVGAASHSLDFRKAAGGFIHGFRYA
ncbi:unnamed protein product, partial [Ixodes persulcatus]